MHVGRLSVSSHGKEDGGTAADMLGHLENQQITKSYWRKKCISFFPDILKTSANLKFDAYWLL